MKVFSVLLLALLVLAASEAQPTADFVDNRPTMLTGIEFSLNFGLIYPPAPQLSEETSTLYMRAVWKDEILGESSQPVFDGDSLVLSGSLSGLKLPNSGNQDVTVLLSYNEDFSAATENVYTVWVIVGGITVIPPLVTVFMAMLTREVLWALFAGIWCCAMIVYQGNVLTAFLRTLDTYLIESLGNIDHAFVIMFSWFLSGMIAVVSKSGGAHGIADVLIRVIRRKRGAMMTVFFLGFVIFFDDYANTLILGGTMRPITDSYFVSREKFAFLVDATTAPIASIAPISSWIGFELGLIQAELDVLAAAGEPVPTSAYDVFLKTIPSRYYPIFMLVFSFMMILSMREFGPMLHAERRAQFEHKLMSDSASVEQTVIDHSLEPDEDVPRRWWNAAVPILATFIVVLVGLILTGVDGAKANGEPQTAANIFGNGDSYSSILWGSFVGSIVIWLMCRFQYIEDGHFVNQWAYWIKFKSHPTARPILTMKESLESWIGGVKSLTTPVLVLIMAWAIGTAVRDSGADNFFSSALSSDSLDYRAIPTLTFIISGVISFATGTSWGTMSIMFPIVVSASWFASDGDDNILVLTISAILAGAVFGDHATAISDTTILSAMSSKCDLTHHVITQMPYALAVAVLSILIGYLPAGFAWEAWIGLVIGIFLVIAMVLLLGVRVDHPKFKEDFLSITTEFIKVKIFRRDPTPKQEVPDFVLEREYKDIFTRNFWTKETFADFFLCRHDENVKDFENFDVENSNSSSNDANDLKESIDGAGIPDSTMENAIPEEAVPLTADLPEQVHAE
mmetsp:Transcript_12418/g.22436  ORF Transcript_12418/g.22436 Transcript_12418/m.22436 type:complete len:794 (-) Transcript_12418:131-2512(-)|eukprot:CAMPEP_0182442268 /NCGR_PEP_ID=MMETSP1172-20130603/1202_1 /TAXON_ID=708627 /ORGANISM="Timspurckia oligopyrenoides, Strain CCMP3278" /LENGTH=793 /DNA_ID=CAMNT_0024637033 /DNA_START=533 /DNA_END=2914 /DNA_ORIENTATION=+